MRRVRYTGLQPKWILMVIRADYLKGVALKLKENCSGGSAQSGCNLFM